MMPALGRYSVPVEGPLVDELFGVEHRALGQRLVRDHEFSLGVTPEPCDRCSLGIEYLIDFQTKSRLCRNCVYDVARERGWYDDGEAGEELANKFAPTFLTIAAPEPVDIQPQPRRGRGRPRKYEVVEKPDPDQKVTEDRPAEAEFLSLWGENLR